MNLLQYYSEISSVYPEFVTQRQMQEICGVCKSTAYKAERHGVIPYEKEVNRLVHTHRIKLTDALAFKYKREHGYLSDSEYISYLRSFYEKRLKSYSDVLTVSDVSEITGFVKNSIHRWVGQGHLRAFTKRRRFCIPKVSLLDFLTSSVYNAIQDKSEQQIKTLNEFEAWYAKKIGGSGSMSAYYDELLHDYPEFITKEQMYQIGHISKKTALLLLQTGLVPCVDNGKKTHTYKIATADIVTYLKQREAMPEKYKLPINSYANGDETPVATHEIFDIYPDVLSVRQAALLSGVSVSTVMKWIKKKKVKSFSKSGLYYIPKMVLIEYMKPSI